MTALNTLLYTINDSGVSLNMRINAKITKIMIIEKDIPEDEPDIMINGNVFERVDNFIYLGQLFTTDGKCEKEIKKEYRLQDQLSSE